MTSNARSNHSNSGQFAFDALLADTAAINRARAEETAHAHLPGTMDAALPYYRRLIEAHHAAMLAGDAGEVSRLRRSAHDLAYKLNGFERGILADDDAPGCVLDRLTRSGDGAVPLWGCTCRRQGKTLPERDGLSQLAGRRRAVASGVHDGSLCR